MEGEELIVPTGELENVVQGFYCVRLINYPDLAALARKRNLPVLYDEKGPNELHAEYVVIDGHTLYYYEGP
jgi:hypothetical protein